jgi:hypothetical protein
MFTNFMATTYQSAPAAVLMNGTEAKNTNFSTSTRVSRRSRRYQRLSR